MHMFTAWPPSPGHSGTIDDADAYDDQVTRAVRRWHGSRPSAPGHKVGCIPGSFMG